MSLILESNEIGDGKFLTAFQLIPAGSRPAMEHGCARSWLTLESIHTDRGIHLGMQRDSVERLLGAPRHTGVNDVTYQATQHRHEPAGNGRAILDYDASSELRVVYRNGRVIALSGSRMDSM